MCRLIFSDIYAVGLISAEGSYALYMGGYGGEVGDVDIAVAVDIGYIGVCQGTDSLDVGGHCHEVGDVYIAVAVDIGFEGVGLIGLF